MYAARFDDPRGCRTSYGRSGAPRSEGYRITTRRSYCLDENDISDDKFDFTEDKAAEAPFDPNKVLTDFHNGAGDYLCLNLGKLNPNGEVSALIWWREEPTRPDFVDFWPALDAWIGISFEDLDHN